MAVVHEGGGNDGRGQGEKSVCVKLTGVGQGTVATLSSHRHPSLALAGSLRFLLAWSRDSAMTDGASQSASDLRCKDARDPHKALHLNQTRMPCTGCCFSHHCMLAVITPECAGGVAPPVFIKLLDYSENRAWTWPCELDSRCLSGGTCHPNRIIVSPDPPICQSTLNTAIPMRYHTLCRAGIASTSPNKHD